MYIDYRHIDYRVYTIYHVLVVEVNYFYDVYYIHGYLVFTCFRNQKKFRLLLFTLNVGDRYT